MGFMQRVKVMLGLADEYDDEYEDEVDEDYADDEYEEPGYEPPAPARDYGREPAREPVREAPREPAYTSPYGAQSASVKRIHREPDITRAREAAPLRAVSAAPPAPGPQPQVKIHTVEPRTYAEVQSIADKFKAGQPVILNLTVTDPDLAKRLIDFASGLTYALDGGVQKVSDRVFMLTPPNVDVSNADRIRSRTSTLFGPE